MEESLIKGGDCFMRTAVIPDEEMKIKAKMKVIELKEAGNRKIFEEQARLNNLKLAEKLAKDKKSAKRKKLKAQDIERRNANAGPKFLPGDVTKPWMNQMFESKIIKQDSHSGSFSFRKVTSVYER